MHSVTFPRCLTPLLAIILIIPGMTVNADDSARSRVEYAWPEVMGYYLPVFWENPYTKIKGRPVVDVIVGRNGKVVQADMITSEYDDQKDLLVNSVYACRFRPALAEGEEIEGFYRYPVQSCFFLKDRDREKGHIDKLPVPQFLISRNTMGKLPLLAQTSRKVNFGFHVTVDADGSISKFRGIEAESNVLAEEHLKELVEKFKFLPAESGGKPVKCNLTMVLYATNGRMGTSTRELTANCFKQNARPVPLNPGNDQVTNDKDYSVELVFVQPGIVQDIKLLSQMSSSEAIATLDAFRKWHLDAEYLAKSKGALTADFRFLDGRETAQLISEQPGPAIQPPRPVRQTAPVYPRELRTAGIEGYVVVEFTVDSKGRIKDPEPVASTHLGFTQEGMAAVKKWKFKPAERKGVPVNCRVRQVIPFRIKQSR